jgi:hypothetical protein
MKIKQFKTKTTLTNYVKDFILNGNELGEIKNKDHIELLNELVKQHYNYEYLKGCGIKSFYITNCDINPRNKKFNILRNDLSSVDFSYKKAILAKEPKHISYLKRAFRLIVKEQTDLFKQNYFLQNQDSKGYIVCPISNLKFKKTECHVDHMPPKTFDFIFNDFFDCYKIDSKSIIIEKTGFDNRPIILNKEIETLFFNYHKEKAELRCLYWRSNLQLPKK